MKQQENAEKVYTKKDVIRGGVIGWGLGVATTFLFAPKSGKELRGDISYQVGTTKDKVVDKSKEFSESAMDKYAEIKDGAVNQSKRIKNKIKPRKNNQSPEAAADEEDSENNSQLQSNEMDKAMGNEEEDSKAKAKETGSSGRKTTDNSESSRNRE